MRDVALILVAGGKGTRFQEKIPKQFYEINKKPIALYSLDVFLKCPEIAEIIVVADPIYHSLFKNYSVKFAPPGDLRQDSLSNGLQMVSSSISWICVHDAARPLVHSALVSLLIKEGKQHGAATLGIPARLTIKEVLETNMVSKTLKRDTLWEIQTPQFAQKNVLIQGLMQVRKNNMIVTDDVSLVELQGIPVKVVKGDVSNIKVTYQEDLPIVKFFLEKNASL